jgi:hypothetical protein
MSLAALGVIRVYRPVLDLYCRSILADFELGHLDLAVVLDFDGDRISPAPSAPAPA